MASSTEKTYRLCYIKHEYSRYLTPEQIAAFNSGDYKNDPALVNMLSTPTELTEKEITKSGFLTDVLGFAAEDGVIILPPIDYAQGSDYQKSFSNPAMYLYDKCNNPSNDGTAYMDETLMSLLTFYLKNCPNGPSYPPKEEKKPTGNIEMDILTSGEGPAIPINEEEQKFVDEIKKYDVKTTPHYSLPINLRRKDGRVELMPRPPPQPLRPDGTMPDPLPSQTPVMFDSFNQYIIKLDFLGRNFRIDRMNTILALVINKILESPKRHTHVRLPFGLPIFKNDEDEIAYMIAQYEDMEKRIEKAQEMLKLRVAEEKQRRETKEKLLADAGALANTNEAQD